jgi:hypothetical protein
VICKRRTTPKNQNLTIKFNRTKGELYTESLRRLKAAAEAEKSIAEMFKLPKGSQSKIKTGLLFLERCLDLLQPGGRLGIVLPEGVFNNPSLQYVREFRTSFTPTTASRPASPRPAWSFSGNSNRTRNLFS